MLKKKICYSLFSGGIGNNGNTSGGYRGSANTVPPAPQQTYSNSYGGDAIAHPPVPLQPPYYGQPGTQVAPQPTQIYHQSIPNAYQQMGQMPRPVNPSQQLDNRGYGQTPQHRMPMQNRS